MPTDDNSDNRKQNTRDDKRKREKQRVESQWDPISVSLSLSLRDTRRVSYWYTLVIAVKREAHWDPISVSLSLSEIPGGYHIGTL
jgi:hypothetical protein